MSSTNDRADHSTLPEEIAEIKRSVARIEHAIAGDQQMGQPGLAHRIASLETSREDHSRRFLILTTLGTTVATVGSFVLSKITLKIFG